MCSTGAAASPPPLHLEVYYTLGQGEVAAAFGKEAHGREAVQEAEPGQSPRVRGQREEEQRSWEVGVRVVEEGGRTVEARREERGSQRGSGDCK